MVADFGLGFINFVHFDDEDNDSSLTSSLYVFVRFARSYFVIVIFFFL